AVVHAADVDGTRAPVVGDPQQVLGRVDDIGRYAEHAAVDVGAPARKARQRGWRAREAVGGLIHGAVAAERDDDGVALVRSLTAELGRVVTGLGVYGVHLVAPLEGVDDEMLQAIGDR